MSTPPNRGRRKRFENPPLLGQVPGTSGINYQHANFRDGPEGIGFRSGRVSTNFVPRIGSASQSNVGQRFGVSSNVNGGQCSHAKSWRDDCSPRQPLVEPIFEQRKTQNNSRYQQRSESTQKNYGKNRGMGFKYIQNLILEEPHDIITRLTNNKEGFKQLLESNLTPDFIVLIIELLGKMCESKFNLLVDLLHIAFNNSFVEKLNFYITNLAYQEDKRTNSFFWNDTDKFWENLLLVLKKIADIIPNFACESLGTLPKVILNNIATIETEKSIHISDSIKEKCKSLIELINDLKKKLERKRAAIGTYEDEGEPPNDFREISVYPTSFEITSTERNFVRKNIIEGPYQSVHHYLDVQFRLLREDFVKPLREGIIDYLNGSNKKIPNIVVHKRIQFIQPELKTEQTCYKVRFNFSKKKQSYKYENSKRFMFGSLVCFTQDFKTVIFGKIADRKNELLENGEVIIGFDDAPEILYGVDYVMIECSIYFEPYFHVLNVMKQMTEDDFPMKKYLIDVDPSKAYPKYLRQTEELVRFGIEDTRFSPLLWPKHKTFYGLNASQKEAFEGALTQEFAIIQGPPGTGKTFLGLKIAQTLLENKDSWYKNTPIVVICYTNHALDQFLEGLLPFTEKIIRVGGQSKNEKLKGHNLMAQKMHLPQSYFHARDKVKECAENIKTITDTVNRIDRLTDVICIDDFYSVNREFVQYFQGNREKQRNWLLEPNEDVFNNFNKNMTNLDINTLTKSNDNEAEQNDADEPLLEDNQPENEHLFNNYLSDLRVFEPELLLSLKYMRSDLQETERSLQILRSSEELTLEQIVRLETSANSYYQIERDLHYLEQRLLEGRNQQRYRHPPEHIDYNNLQTLPPDQRWHLYFYTLYQYRNHLITEYDKLNITFRTTTQRFNEIREMEHLKLMKGNLVVGMTTTGAARLYASLQALKSPIVIVEEAAEVLEAHIVTSLTRSCQHLILIGDHKQLKPSTSDFQMERDYKLGISLFERMVLNKVQCFTLNVQHRMRPEISRLITPSIYPDLQDHHSVNSRPLISGIDNCVFFLDHQEKEEECSNQNASKKNVHEATFLIRLARHLILNGYKPENITIIAAYLGQMYEMLRERKMYQHLLGDVRITVLDNYQGEECDIILLSLVRSNAANKIGFLSIENRVCVALSRARNGFYVMGNMGQLCSQSKLWTEIKSTLQNQYSIGPSLRLRCQVHTDKTTNVTTAADFNKISEGGCDQQCGAVLPCNHTCQSLCHIQDREHKNYNCHEPCTRLLCDTNPTHLCKKKCYQECGPCNYKVTRLLPCNHEVVMFCYENPDEYKCLVGVETKLPCEHVVIKPCHADPLTFKCPEPCVTRVEPCGHACKLTCHVRKDPDHLEYTCTRRCAKHRQNCSQKIDLHMCPKLCYEKCEPCTILVDKKRTICPHQYKTPCCEDVDAITCVKPCKKILQCGHPCKSKCFEACGPCKVRVEKIVPDCNHTVLVPCFETDLRKYCTKTCPRIMTCGHKCQAKCLVEPCEPSACKEIVNCLIKGECGHYIKTMQCNIYQKYSRGELKTSESEIWSHCDYSCDKKLNCSSKEEDKHACAGTCGKCYQGRLHLRCQAKCGAILVCNHECPIPCRETCQPCQIKCTTKCEHSKCSKKCGEPCSPCKEPCTRKCEHIKCKRNCGLPCEVPPCTEFCDKTLKCGHPCVGFCGDPCPPLCRICNKDELEEILFGNEDEPDARFVYLNDCKHVLKSEGLEEWLNQNEQEIKIKVCPKCKTPILTTKRFSDYVKKAFKDIENVKKKIFGSEKNNNTKREQLLEIAKKVHEDFLKIPMLNITNKILQIQKFEFRLQPVKKGKHNNNFRQGINNTELVAIENKLLILKDVQQIIIDADIKLNDTVFKQLKFIVDALCRSVDSITNQEHDDISSEIMRLQRILQFEKIRNQESYQYAKTRIEVTRIENKINETLFKRSKFTILQFDNLKTDLDNFNKEIGTKVPLTDRERSDIVKAMGFTQGHWYKCPNGHYYCIADCGGANQVSKCNECGASIGGTGHRLLTGNMLASEIDGARYSAWSEQANMANYRF